MTEPPPPSRLALVLLASVIVFWGINFPIAKIALNEIPPLTFRALCVALGGAGLLLIGRASGRSLALPRNEIAPLLLVSFFNVTIWHVTSAYGISLIAAGRATIISHTMPVWAVPLSYFILGERLTATRAIGLVVGVAGLAVLVGPDLAKIGAAPGGAFITLVAAISWATGVVLIKRFHWTTGATVQVGWQLVLGGAPIVAGALILDPLPNPSNISAAAIAAAAYSTTVPILYCQWAYFRVVRLLPTSVATVGMLVVPVIAVFVSAVLLDEAVGIREVASLALVTLAVVLAVGGAGLAPRWPPAWRGRR